MNTKDIWTNEELEELYKLRQEGKSFRDIAKVLHSERKYGAYSRKYKRMNWTDFFSGQDENYVRGKWSDEEMIQLDAFLQTGSSYAFIASRMNRSMESVESQAKNTDWKAWRQMRKVEQSVDVDQQIDATDDLLNHILNVCRFDVKSLVSLTEKEFLSKINADSSSLMVKFSELKEQAQNKLVEIGFGNPETITLPKGRYIVVGDSHGKHTRKKMFAMLRKVNGFLKPDKIIHVGHILDDDNDISYDWGNFKNLIILAKIEELKTIQEQRNKYDFNYEISRENVVIGDLVITSQDLISDYVKTPISNLDSEILYPKTIVNCHRLELFSRCHNDGPSYIVSPGCLCDPHVVRTIKQIDYKDGRVVKQAFHEGFIKYRRMGHLNKYWEQGMLVVDVDAQGNHTVVPCQIKKTDQGFATSYFDKIISSNGIHNPSKKIFVSGDLHCDLHDSKILDIQEKICKDYKPDVHVNLGDTMNYSSLNHHIMDRGHAITNKTVLDESANSYFVLSRIKNWAKESYIIYGNHERFAKDFVEKYPQFKEYLDIRFVCCLDQTGYNLVPIKNVLKIGNAKFIHGEIRMYGQSGNILEKSSRTFGKNVCVGHVHKPGMRFGSCSIGLSGILDHKYNEAEASNWIRGMGLCNQWMGESWITTIGIDTNNICYLNKKAYKPTNVESWSPKKYKAKLVYDFEK